MKIKYKEKELTTVDRDFIDNLISFFYESKKNSIAKIYTTLLIISEDIAFSNSIIRKVSIGCEQKQLQKFSQTNSHNKWLIEKGHCQFKMLSNKEINYNDFKILDFNEKYVTPEIEKRLRHFYDSFYLATEIDKHNTSDQDIIPSINLYREKEESEIKRIKKLSKKERRQKLPNSDTKPEKIIVTQTVFKRNPYVVVEVLERANGICEKCGNDAPFLRDRDNSPYLEVHHIKSLSADGDDTVENSIALCPNCHRQAHYGMKSY